jgi:hypothetical protein
VKGLSLSEEIKIVASKGWCTINKPVWDFLWSLVGCSLKKVQAFLNGVVMVFFQEAILRQSFWISYNLSLQWVFSLGLVYNTHIEEDYWIEINNKSGKRNTKTKRKKERSKIREMRLIWYKEHHSFLLTSLISLIKAKTEHKHMVHQLTREDLFNFLILINNNMVDPFTFLYQLNFNLNLFIEALKVLSFMLC